VLENLKGIERGEIPRDQIPIIWTERKKTVLETPSTCIPRGPSRAVQYARQDGAPLFSVRESGESGPVLRFSKAVSHVLDDAFWTEIQAQVERRLQQAQNFSTEK
jgi:hypothetical protein